MVPARRADDGAPEPVIVTHLFSTPVSTHAMSTTNKPRIFQRYATVSNPRLYATWDIIGETLTLLRYRRTYREALTFLTEVKPHLRVVNYGETVRGEAEQIFRRYGRDHKLSFCDAVSFVVVTTLLDDVPSLAFDADFRALGLIVIP
jgi:predicted nucleic acid-binding protein